MKCYIYKIVNQVTNEKYVGQTTNFSRRKQVHLFALRNNKHINPKLQNGWNKYGEENFYWEHKNYDLTKEELDDLEIENIKSENSYINGYNLTKGVLEVILALKELLPLNNSVLYMQVILNMME